MKFFRVVRVEKVKNPSGSIGIRHKPFGANRNTREEAVFLAKELTRLLGGRYEVQERKNYISPLMDGIY